MNLGAAFVRLVLAPEGRDGAWVAFQVLLQFRSQLSIECVQDFQSGLLRAGVRSHGLHSLMVGGTRYATNTPDAQGHKRECHAHICPVSPGSNNQFLGGQRLTAVYGPGFRGLLDLPHCPEFLGFPICHFQPCDMHVVCIPVEFTSSRVHAQEGLPWHLSGGCEVL